MANAAASTASSDEFRFWAFISYSHRDEETATWLHRALETFRVPRGLAGHPDCGPPPRRLFPIVRDRDELPGASDLGVKIRDALGRARFLIVICSRQAAVSRWVDEEVRYRERPREGNRAGQITIGRGGWSLARRPSASDK
jgi:hypothetical protein